MTALAHGGQHFFVVGVVGKLGKKENSAPNLSGQAMPFKWYAVFFFSDHPLSGFPARRRQLRKPILTLQQLQQPLPINLIMLHLFGVELEQPQ